MERKELERVLTDLFVGEFSDYVPNGLQLEGRAMVRRLAVAVSATEAVIDQAISWGADALLVHHGWFWKNEAAPIVGAKYRKIRKMMENEMSLLAFHLPLDAAKGLGNNHSLCVELNMVKLEPFCEVGWMGDLACPISAEKFQGLVDGFYPKGGVWIWPKRFLENQVRRVAVLSGGGQNFFSVAIEHEVDVYVTGESTEWVYSLAHETGVGYAAMGHYNSETIGVKKTGEWLAEKFDVSVRFFGEDNPF